MRTSAGLRPLAAADPPGVRNRHPLASPLGRHPRAKKASVPLLGLDLAQPRKCFPGKRNLSTSFAGPHPPCLAMSLWEPEKRVRESCYWLRQPRIPWCGLPPHALTGWTSARPGSRTEAPPAPFIPPYTWLNFACGRMPAPCVAAGVCPRQSGHPAPQTVPIGRSIVPCDTTVTQSGGWLADHRQNADAFRFPTRLSVPVQRPLTQILPPFCINTTHLCP